MPDGSPFTLGPNNTVTKTTKLTRTGDATTALRVTNENSNAIQGVVLEKKGGHPRGARDRRHGWDGK
jgi:hypothetical protein